MNKKISSWPTKLLSKGTTDIDCETYNKSDLDQLIGDLIDTCNVAMGLGLAANQINRPESIFVLRPKSLGVDNPDPSKQNEDFMVCINPSIENVFDESGTCETVRWNEGCLSLPGLEMNTPRVKNILLKYMSEDFKPCELELDFPLSAVVQHEMDHLAGKTIAHVGRKSRSAALTLSFWRKKRLKEAKKASKR